MRRIFVVVVLAVTLAVGLFLGKATAAPTTVLASNCGNPFTLFESSTQLVYFADSTRPGSSPWVKFGIETWTDNCMYAVGKGVFFYVYAVTDLISHPSSNQATLRVENGRTGGLLWEGYTYWAPAQSDQISVQSPTFTLYPQPDGFLPMLRAMGSNTDCCTPSRPYAYNPGWSPTIVTPPLAMQLIFNQN